MMWFIPKKISIALILCAVFVAAAFFIISADSVHAAVADGDLLKSPLNPDVYIVKIYGGKRFKRLILNPDIFNQYGHLKWENIQLASEDTLASFVTSDLVRAVGDARVWKLYPQGDTGSKRQIADPASFAALECDWDAIYEINTFERDSYYVTQNAAPDKCAGMNWTNPITPPPPSSQTSDAFFVGEYWNFPTGTGVPPLFPTVLPQHVRNDAEVNFTWGYNAPAPNVNSDKFLARWTKDEYFPSGNYTFVITSDDGVRLWIDSTLLINKWFDHNAYSYSAGWVSTGATYRVRMEYYENQYQATAKLAVVKK